MNILDFIIIAILGFSLLSGMYKGAIASGLSVFGFVGAWLGAQSLYDKVANFALSNNTLMAVLNQYLEPETFFTNHSQAVTAVSDVIAGGEQAISAAVRAVAEKFPMIESAFSANVRNQAFQKLGITTLADYFDQTLWVAVFNVVAFVLLFFLIYWVISLIINMLNKVICFPVMRVMDSAFGGLLGLLRGYVVATLLICILPAFTSLISPELTGTLQSGSTLYNFLTQTDLFVSNWISTLIMG